MLVLQMQELPHRMEAREEGKRKLWGDVSVSRVHATKFGPRGTPRGERAPVNRDGEGAEGPFVELRHCVDYESGVPADPLAAARKFNTLIDIPIDRIVKMYR